MAYARESEPPEAPPEPVQLTAEIINGFVMALLAPQYDRPKPIPKFHMELWDIATDLSEQYVVFQAPRGHAKSTAMTHAYVLAMMLFRVRDYCIIFSDTESQAAEFLGDIKMELEENAALRAQFGVDRFVKDNTTDVIVRMTDGHLFRIRAKGAEQKVRGVKWRGKRPNLVIGDDLENDEMVENSERREKARKWFMKAILPMGSEYCLYRVAGTILHMDSLLNRLLHDKTWTSKSWKAHERFNDFSNILWIEQFPEARLRSIQAKFVAQNDPEGYAQEYLGDPIAEGKTYFRKQDFIVPEEFAANGEGKAIGPPLSTRLAYVAAGDLAISEKEKADYCAFGVAGIDSEGYIHLVRLYHFRGDADDIIETMLEIGRRYNPEIFTLETEKIDKAIGPSLNRAMMRSNPPVFLNIEKVTPSQSKTTRGRSSQRMHKAGAFRFYPGIEHYDAFQAELMQVTNEGPKGTHDDFFDMFSYIGLTVDMYNEAESDEEIEEAEYEEAWDEYMDDGRSAVTGY